MYKDVCKRISAFMLTVCLIVTMVEWPTTVWAGQGTVNTYRNGDGVLAGAPCEAQAVKKRYMDKQGRKKEKIQSSQ